MNELKPNGLVSGNGIKQTTEKELKPNGLVSANNHVGETINSVDANNDGMFDVRDLVAAKKKQLTSSGTVRQYNDQAVGGIKDRLLNPTYSDNIRASILPRIEQLSKGQTLSEKETSELQKLLKAAKDDTDLSETERSYYGNLYAKVLGGGKYSDKQDYYNAIKEAIKGPDSIAKHNYDIAKKNYEEYLKDPQKYENEWRNQHKGIPFVPPKAPQEYESVTAKGVLIGNFTHFTGHSINQIYAPNARKEGNGYAIGHSDVDGSGRLDYLTEGQAMDALYLFETTKGNYSDKTKAVWDYLNSEEIKNGLGQQYYASEMEKAKEAFNESSFVEKVGLNIASVMSNVYGSMVYAGKTIAEQIKGTYDPYSSDNVTIQAARSLRGWQAEEIENAVKGDNSKFRDFLGEAAAFVYEAGMMVIDNIVGYYGFGGDMTSLSFNIGKVPFGIMPYTVSMGLGAYSDKVHEGYSKGLSKSQIVALATISGLSETLTEGFGMEQFANVVFRGKSGLLNSMFAEFSEEIVAGYLNDVADIAISGGKSEFAEKVKEYINQGYTDTKAVGRAIFDMGFDHIKEGVTAALSVGIGATPNAIIGTTTYMRYGKKANAQNNGTALRDIALTLPANSEAYKTAKKYAGDKKLSNFEIGKILIALKQELNSRIEPKIIKAIENRLVELGVEDASYKADLIFKMINLEDLSAEEKAIITNDEATKKVYTDLITEHTASEYETPDLKWIADMFADTKAERTAKTAIDMSITMPISESAYDIIEKLLAGENNAVDAESDQEAETDAGMNSEAVSSAEAEAAPATKSESGFEEVSVKPITVKSTDLSGIETTEVDTKHLSAKQRTVRSIGRALGVKITFANVENADGYYIKGSNEIVMDYNTVDPIRTVMVHEITHFAQNNEKAWSGFVAAVQKSEAFAKWINGYNYTYYDNAEAAKNDKHTSNKLNIIKEDIKQLYLANGEELSNADIEYEVYAKFCGETLFASEETRDESLESILAGATQKDRNAISRFIHKFVEWIKSKLPNTSYSATLERLENKWLEMVKDTEVEAKENSAEDSGVRYSIGVLENGNTFVIGDRNIITASDVSGMRKQITNFFNDLLQNKESIDIPTIDGDVLTITKSETAKKARDNYKTENGKSIKMSLDEFSVKLRAESHIDELAEISFGNDTKADIKSHKFAKDGFVYKTAYFQDYDGQYYRINLSVGIKDKIATVYNIGKIKEDKLPSAKLIAVVGSKPLGNLSSNNIILNNSETVKENVAESESDTQKSIPSENVRHNQERYLKWLYKSWGLTKYSEEDLKADIKDLRHAVAIYNKGGKYREEARGIIERLAEKALTKYERVRLTSDAKGIRKAIRSYTFKLTDKQKQEAEYYYGSVSKFAKATGLKISDNANMWLDSLWQEWSEMYPEFFNEDMNEGDMIERLASVIDSLSNMTESYDVDEMLSYNVPEIANQIIYDLENSGDPAKRKAVEEYKKNVVEPQRIGRTKTEIRGQIKGLYDRMLKMDQNPTKYSYIPKQFRDAVRELLYVASGIHLKRNSTELPAKIAAVCDKYQRLKNNQDPDVQSVYDENVALELQDLRDLLEEKPIYDEDMSVPVLRQIYRHMRSIYGMIMDAKSLIGEKEKLSIQEAGQDIVFEQDEIRKNKSAQNTVEKWFSNANNVSSFFYLNSLRAVLRMSNYNENTTLYRMFYALNQGLQKSYDFQMRINKKLDALVKTKEGQKAYEEAVNKKIDFGWGKMTKMQVAQIMLTLKRESAIGTVHIIKGGATITDSKYHDNVTKRRDNAETIRFGYMNMSYLDDMQEVIDNDKWLQEYIKVAKEILQKDTAKAINETSEILVHRDMAVGDEYIPFVTDRSFVVQEIEEVVRDATLEGNGHLKSTLKRAGNALYIEGLDVVLADAINFAAKYSGLAIPIRNINKVLNYKNDLAGQSVKNSIKKNWKKQGLDIITQTIADLQTVRKNDRIAIIDNLKAAFITSTLAGNISVSIKQAASLFTAFSVLNYRNPATVWAKFAKTVKNYDSIIEEIDKHTSEHWRRRIGLTTDEVAAIQQNTGFFGKLTKKLPKAINGLKWIQAIDCFTTATFWNMAKEDISKQINKGELDAEVGDEVYWKEVTELYEKTIEETQPMYDPLHRSEMQKNAVSNKIFMFKTQPLQNAGLFFTDLHALLSAKATGDKLLIKERSNQLVKTIISQTESAITFAIMTLAAAALMGNMKRYKDKDNEVTLSSVLGMVGQDALKTGTGVLFPIGGSEVFDYLSALREKKSFGRSLVSHPVVEWFNKYADSISTLYKEPSFDNIVNMLTMLGDLTGQPVTNYKKIIRGVVWNIEDAVNGDLGDFIAGDEKAHEKGAKIKRIIVASEKGDTKKKNDLITRFRKEYPEENIQALIHKQYMLDKEIIAQAEKALSKVGKAYSELSEDQQKDVVTDVKGYNATEKAIEIKGLDKADFDNLYTLKRTNTAKYKDEEQRLLKKYSGAEVSQGLEYAKVRYMVSKGISVERYYASKKYANSYDPDKSGGASEKEKRAALKKLGFTEEQIRAFLAK